MLSATEVWGLLDLRRKSQLMEVASTDYSLTDAQRLAFKTLAEELYRAWIKKLPTPSSEMVELARNGNRITAIKLYREAHQSAKIGLHEAMVAIDYVEHDTLSKLVKKALVKKGDKKND